MRIIASIAVLATACCWTVPPLVSVAHATDSQPFTTAANTTADDCQMSQAALEAINTATAEYINQGRQDPAIGDLIDEAKSAGWPPECDSVRAEILANKAKTRLGMDEESASSAKTPVIKKPLFTRFDGPWEFGLNAELIEQEGIRSTSFFDSLVDDKYGLHVGKEFYRTDKWRLGGQVHFVRTNDADVDDPDELDFDSTSLFATARHEALPALQFKLGVTRADYENFYESDTETGLVYGIGLTTGNDDVRFHWLDYEVHKIGGEKFEVFSVNILVIFCVAGMFYGGDCF